SATAHGAPPVVVPADPTAPIRERAIASEPSARSTEPITMAPIIADDGGPTVRVTIRRLEVRAILPAPGQAPKPARRTPRTVAGPSLDEYLKRRGSEP